MIGKSDGPEVVRLLVSEESMAGHFHGLAPDRCDSCWYLGFVSHCEMEACAGRIREELEPQTLDRAAQTYQQSLQAQDIDESWKWGSVYLINGEGIITKKELFTRIDNRRITFLRF